MKSHLKVLALGLVVIFFTNCQKQEPVGFDVLAEDSNSLATLKSTGLESDYSIFLNTLIAQIQELGLNRGNTNALTVKINAAIRSFDRGKINAAENQLSAFIHQVRTFEKVGKLTAEQAAALIEMAQKAIDGNFQLWAPGDDWTDVRDNQVYKTVLIGDQCWFAENLAYIPEDLAFPAEINSSYDYRGGVVLDKANVLYNGYAAITPYGNITNTADICPDGWHLPTDEEWFALEEYLESISDEAVAMQLKSTEGWDWGNGTNSSGFNAYRTGILFWGDYNEFHTHFWSSEYEENGFPYFWIRSLNVWDETLSRYGSTAENTGYSIRCIKD